jgi:acyl transferase domain-containing protein/acyl-CoA synthetase (AMP-forming)/AMP-acid ligase II/NADPH:quinone reductase-like Zn-dependent oxidoreductase/acyl carrier protein/NADP-dependent 3-hydroxy acid dehydrogenase YdfG
MGVERRFSLVYILRRRACTTPDELYFRYLQTGDFDGPMAEFTWAQHDLEARRIAARLQALGASGERVLLLFPPGAEFAGAFMGCLYAGAIAVPAFPPDPSRLARTLPRLEAIADDAQARFALAPEAICRMGEAIASVGLGGVAWVAADGAADERDGAEGWELPSLTPASVAFLQYTSGSTGSPRGVVVTHANLLHNLELIRRSYRAGSDSRGVIWLPAYHDMGLIGGLLQPLYTGFTVTLMSPLDFLRRPIRWLEAITRVRATISGGPDFAYRMCTNKIRDEELAGLDLSSWEVAFTGAEPVRATTLEAFADRFAACGFDRRALYPTYGLAEATLMVTGAVGGPREPVLLSADASALEAGRVEPADARRRHTLVSCGVVDEDSTLVIVDPDTHRPRAEGEVGEIWVRGPGVAAGYWNDPKTTRARFDARLAGDDGGGFLRTGDLGVCIGGELYVTGRRKDLLILRGRNVYPHDLEILAQQAHPRVRPGCVAAFSVEHEGEERAVLVAEVDERGGELDLDAIAGAIRSELGRGAELELHAIGLLRRGTIPKTSSGKIQRHACRRAWEAGTLETHARVELAATRPAAPARTVAPATRAEAIAALTELVAAELGRPSDEIPVDEPLHALGLDSLRLIELTAHVEAVFARPLETLTLFNHPSIDKLASFLIQLEPSADAAAGLADDATAGVYCGLDEACADIERRSTRYQFDLEGDVAWARIDEPGLYVPEPWLRELGFDVDGLRAHPEVFDVLQWALALHLCMTFEFFEFGVVFFTRDQAARLGRTRSVELLALEEEKHIQLFRRYARYLREQRPELAARVETLTGANLEAIRTAMDETGGDAPAVRHYAIWLKFLFFEEYTVHLHQRLRRAEGIQPTWLSAHAAHRREEVQHIATDVRYLRALDLDEAERRRLSALFTRQLIEDFDRQFGIEGARRLCEALYPEVPLMIERPHRAQWCLQYMLRDRTFAHSWRAAPFFREATRIAPEQLLDAATRAAGVPSTRAPVCADAHAEPVAIVGIGCRFPGAVDSPDAMWKLLLDGVDAITEVPIERWDVDAWFDPDPAAPGKMYTRWGGFIDHITDFDHGFFGITPKEARNMDPQQRLLLEVSWEALEHAGLRPSALQGSATGVFVGICSQDFTLRTMAEPIDAYSGTGTVFSVAAGRISYVLGLTGPCLAIDTACSSSLVAVHQACRALENGEAELALAAGVNAILVPKSHVFFSKLRAMSPVGRCKTFDATADGYVRSEGCGVVVLKRLADARRDGDRILAVIRGSAVNQDGRSNGLTAPRGTAQEAVMRAALARADLTAEQIDYVEAHGTGTPLGDPIELQAIGAVHRGRPSPVLVGSVKTQIGHGEGAAGVAGLIKAALIVERGRIPANLHFRRPTPHVPWAELPIEVVSEARELDELRFVAVNAFGFGGTNAHVIVERGPTPPPAIQAVERPLHPIVISGHTPAALAANAGRLADALAHFGDAQLADVAHTLSAGRDHHELRAAFMAGDIAGARARLAELEPPATTDGAPKVALLFTGQGAGYPGMGRTLYETQPVFRAVIDELATYFDPLLDRSLRESLFAADANMSDTGVAQPTLFALELALASLWRSWGVEARLVLGHSIGEIAAACFAGALSMADGAELVAARGRLMQALPAGGAMWALAVDPDTAARELREFGERLALAAVNTPAQVVISGDEEAAATLARRMSARGVDTRRLDVSHAFHSARMRPMLAELEAVVRGLRLERPALRVISAVDASLDASALQRPGYWVEHAIRPVRFAAALAAALAEGVDALIEVGPRPTLLGLAAKSVDESCLMLPSLRPGLPDWAVLGESLCRLYTRGASIDWEAFEAPYGRRRVTLPSYAFQRERAWAEEAPALSVGGATGHPLLGARLDVAGREIFETTLELAHTPWLGDHRVAGAIVVPASAWIELLRAAAGECGGAVAVELQAIELQRALLLADDERRRVQVVVETRADGRIVEAFSRPPGAEAGWILHACARIADAASAESMLAPPPQQVERRVDLEPLRAALERVGLEYGPCFHGLRGLARVADGLVAEVALPAVVDNWERGLHPALLDAVFQAAGALADAPANTLLLPVGAASVRLWAEGARAVRAWLRRDEAGALDLRLDDLDGQPVAELRGLELREADVGMFRRRSRREPDSCTFALRWDPAPPREPPTLAGAWWVVGDDELAAAVHARLLAMPGVEARRLASDAIAGEDPPAELAGIVVVAPTDVALEQLSAALMPTLRLAQARAPGTALTLVTRGAQAIADGDLGSEAALVGASLWGLGRTIQQEALASTCKLVDLAPTPDTADTAAAVIAELGPDRETQVARRGNRRLVARLVETEDPRLAIPDAPSWRLCQRERGDLDSLALEPSPRPQPGPGEVEVGVEAAGLNFRDVLGALGMLPGPAAPLGGEFAGRITAVGPGVTALEVGDPVMGIARSSFARHVITDARLVTRRPSTLDASEAATVPIAFLTAWYGLYELAGLIRGEWCLIHAAAGGVGMAAVQLARRAGARVIGTASPGKWSAVRELGVTHVFSSREPGSAPAMRELTEGAGVDVILNSLIGPFILDGFAALAEGGRFIEMGKAEIWTQAQVREVHASAHYRAFDLLDVDPDHIQRMLVAIVAAFETGELRALPRRSFALSEAVTAFRTMAQARHVGKIVLLTEQQRARLDSRATWLISGGLGGLGMHVARWLIDHGARQLALVGRAELDDARRTRVASLRTLAPDLDVHYFTADLAHASAVEALVAEIGAAMPPLRGVVHAAGVLDDALLSEQGRARFDAVIGAKVGGAWALHRATRELPLEAFVCFSSIVAALGGAGQANYAAANAALDGLAHHRRAAGLAGVSIAWGPWAGDGMAARLDPSLQRRMLELGLQAIEPELGVRLFGEALRSETAQLLVVPLDRARLRRRMRGLPPPLWSVLVPPEHNAGPSLRERLARLEPELRHAELVEHLRDRVARIMGATSRARVSPTTPLRDLGLDSLMAVDFHGELSRTLGRALDETLLFDHPTLERLADHLLVEVLALAPDRGADKAGRPGELTSASPRERELADELAALEAIL